MISCTVPSCTHEVADGRVRGGLCTVHLYQIGRTEETTRSVTAHDGSSPNPGDSIGSEPGRSERVLNDSSPSVVSDLRITFHFPLQFLDCESFINIALADGQKKPAAPWTWNGYPTLAPWKKDPDVRTSAERAIWYADQNEFDPAFVLEKESGIVFLDFDDVRDPATGELHPEVAAAIERSQSYAKTSTSGTGVHLFLEGELPDNVSAITADLPATNCFPNPSVEAYDNVRLVSLGGTHLPTTPTRAVENPAFIDEFVAEYDRDPRPPAEAEYVPELSREEVQAIERTSDSQTLWDAIAHTSYGDFRLASPQTEGGTGYTDRKSFDPTWEQSDSGTRLGHEGGKNFIYRNGNVALDALQVVALEEGIIDTVGEYPRGQEYWQAVDALRDRGAPIPEYTGPTSSVVLLPETAEQERTGDLTKAEAQKRTIREIKRALEDPSSVIPMLPSGGKTRGFVKAVSDEDKNAIIAVPRGREEQYDEIEGWAADEGISCKVLPSVHDFCETFTGAHGDDAQKQAQKMYGHGVTASEIHNRWADWFGEPIPCHRNCSYKAELNQIDDSIQLLIGHYQHLHGYDVLKNRLVAIDEFPDLVTSYGDRNDVDRDDPFNQYVDVATNVNRFCQNSDGFPFDSYVDIIENREKRYEEALDWYEQDGTWRKDPGLVPEMHAMAPVFTYALIFAEDLGNGWEYTRLPRRDNELHDLFMGHLQTGYRSPGEAGKVAAFNRTTGALYILDPPTFGDAEAVIGLDGTPTQELWNLVLGAKPNIRHVLSEDERAEYLQSTLGHQYVQVTEQVNSIMGGNINEREIEALVTEITGKHDTIATIGPPPGKMDYTPEGPSAYYGNLLGKNTLATERVGLVMGAPHYGDDFLKLWGALSRESVEPIEDKNRRDYTGVGHEIRHHMAEHNVLQAMLRFGRDGNGAIVYVNTSAIPDWVPRTQVPGVVKTASNGEERILTVFENADAATVAEVKEATELSERQIRRLLKNLTERGLLEKSWQAGRNVYSPAVTELPRATVTLDI